MCLEVTLTRLYQKTNIACNGWVPDMDRTKTDKTDSNQRRTVDISPVRSVTSFVHVQSSLMDLPNVNRHGTDTLNAKHIENGN